MRLDWNAYRTSTTSISKRTTNVIEIDVGLKRRAGAMRSVIPHREAGVEETLKA